MKHRDTLIALLVLTASGCAGNRLEPLAPFAGTGGVTIAPVKIESSPTTAWIYIDGKYVGNTPLVYGLAYDSNTSYIEVTAEPLPDHPGQLRQTRHIRVPPLPNSVHFFLNNSDELEHDG